MTEEADSDFMAAAGMASTQEKTLAVRMFSEPQQDEAASKKEGRPVYRDVPMIEIRIPGQIDFLRREISEQDKADFPKHYAAFLKNESQEAVEGTPLAQWPILSRAQVEEAKYLGARTVEQLAETSDVALQRFGPGWKTLRQQARDWLIKAKDGAILARLRTELEERDVKIRTLEDMLNRQAHALAQAGIGEGAVRVAPAPDPEVAALKEMVQKLVAAQGNGAAEPPKRKPGRPRKIPPPPEQA